MWSNNKRVFMVSGASLLLVIGLAVSLQKQETPTTVVVYKTPTCGCCSKWVDHMQTAGFVVEVHDLDNLSAIKSRYGIGPKLSACHTAVVGDYVVEGHVPAAHVERLLREKPTVVGITVPGMPMGSPGMEGTYTEPYDVLAFDATGRTAVFAHVTGN